MSALAIIEGFAHAGTVIFVAEALKRSEIQTARLANKLGLVIHERVRVHGGLDLVESVCFTSANETSKLWKNVGKPFETNVIMIIISI